MRNILIGLALIGLQTTAGVGRAGYPAAAVTASAARNAGEEVFDTAGIIRGRHGRHADGRSTGGVRRRLPAHLGR